MRNLNNCNTKNHCFFTWTLTYMPLIAFVALQYHYFNTFFINIAKVINCLYKKHIRLLDTYAAKSENSRPPYMFPSITQLLDQFLKIFMHFLDQVTKDVKSMFTFEKWPLATQLAFKTYKHFGHFEFQLCHLRSLFKHTSSHTCTSLVTWSKKCKWNFERWSSNWAIEVNVWGGSDFAA